MAMLEIACFTAESALIAAAAGADRIELCDNQRAGGTTPPAAWLRQVKAKVKTPVFIMIRPRGGNFQYTDREFAEMKVQIDSFRSEADGFVFGLLDEARQVDLLRTRELVERASPLPCTFHRAFDETADPMQALEDVVSAGCSAILSSGGASDALAGASILNQLVRRASGRINIIAGGGLRLSNIEGIRSTAGVSICHSSAIIAGSALPDASEIRQMKHFLKAATSSSEGETRGFWLGTDVILGQLEGG